ncbi:uroporphyrinogen decarboxylase family protein [Parasporobacterium paucivorans]|uniref:Uroporphyrinogen decarboxylase (URO-D) n=1 Tax=Parasporobacterium paucivorans DSM 15970 TaxID=1122934 RepID=A0A1M6GWX6_9FIRM|nr:uroporphyrinogen decarboxylase family protein [Parasporobacterium paucivorans]SHJ14446.1 Uroporphyrinogen decarboxylase (URO-D) [Parasporobacterium paucivorans DSM 15970]
MSCNPFNKEEELKDMGMYKDVPSPYGFPPVHARKFNTPITPKENFQLLMQNKKPCWMPVLPIDSNIVQPEVMPDAFARNHGGIDWFGIDWAFEPKSNAAMVRPNTRRLSDITEWEKELVWPDLNTIDWKKDYEENYKDAIDPDRFTTFMIVNGLFERTADLTSFGDTFCYLLEEQEALEAFYTKLTDFHIDLIKIAKEVYGADMITFHDDMGTQRSPFMSNETFREVMMPHYQRMNAAAHDMGLYVNYHCCGNVEPMIPLFIEAGFDLWEGQDNANNKLSIMENYGDKMAQVSIMVGDPALPDEDLRKLITDLVNTVGKTGRFIPYYIETNPDRSFDSYELFYVLSRELYSR